MGYWGCHTLGSVLQYGRGASTLRTWRTKLLTSPAHPQPVGFLHLHTPWTKGRGCGVLLTRFPNKYVQKSRSRYFWYVISRIFRKTQNSPNFTKMSETTQILIGFPKFFRFWKPLKKTYLFLQETLGAVPFVVLNTQPTPRGHFSQQSWPPHRLCRMQGPSRL